MGVPEWLCCFYCLWFETVGNEFYCYYDRPPTDTHPQGRCSYWECCHCHEGLTFDRDHLECGLDADEWLKKKLEQ